MKQLDFPVIYGFGKQGGHRQLSDAAVPGKDILPVFDLDASSTFPPRHGDPDHTLQHAGSRRSTTANPYVGRIGSSRAACYNGVKIKHRPAASSCLQA